MRKLFGILFLTVAAFGLASAQVRPRAKPTPAATPVVEEDLVVKNGGSIRKSTYSSRRFGFELVMPPSWYFAGRDFERILKNDGIDLSVKAPNTIGPTARATVDRSVKDLDILFTAFRTEQDKKNVAVLRVAAEDLRLEPGVKDAVDYFDAVRATYRSLPLPADFQYSETQAEQLGAMQFGFLDTSSKAGKKRVYAIVRKGYAIVFALTYTADEDLAALRRVLEEGNFDIK